MIEDLFGSEPYHVLLAAIGLALLLAYALTASGAELAGALRLLAQWGVQQSASGATPLQHATCGTVVDARFTASDRLDVTTAWLDAFTTPGNPPRRRPSSFVHVIGDSLAGPMTDGG